MEALAKDKDADIPTQIGIALQALYPLLETHAAEVQKVKRKTFKYGPTDRHQLDVYYPSASATGKAPVIWFVYGGGYHSGNRQLPSPYGLVYTNVGAFYAERGFVTIIADYRTLPNMQFPDPSKDIKDAIAYAVSHADEINSDAPVQADLDQIFVMGHSAGAAILASMFLLPDFLPIELKSRIRGAILKAGVYHFHTKTSGIPSDTITAYYGSAENISRNEPLALLDAASDDAVRSLPDILGVVSEYEVASVNESHLDFFNTLRKRTGEDYHQLVMKGHNHISPHIALCTGVGEQWANDVADWIKARVMKPSL